MVSRIATLFLNAAAGVGESNHHGYPKKHPPADLKSVKPIGAHPLPAIFLGQLYQVISMRK